MPSSSTLEVTTHMALADLREFVVQAEGFADLVASLRAGRSGSIDGAWGSSAALACATLAATEPTTLLIALAHPGDVDAFADDLAGFAGQGPIVVPVATAGGTNDPAVGQRLRVLQHLQSSRPPRIVLAPIAALMQPVPEPAQLAARGRRLRAGDTLDPEEFAHWLHDHGYKRVEAVEYPGEFARRGGLIDVYSPDADVPLRLELFGDELEALRPFSPQTQRSLGTVSETVILAQQAARSAEDDAPRERGHLVDYLSADSWVVMVEPGDLRDQGRAFLERQGDPVGLFPPETVFAQLTTRPSVTVSAMPAATVETTFHLRVESVERLSGNVANLREELDSIGTGTRLVLIACETEAERHRLGEVLAAGQLAQSDRLLLVAGRVRAGFRLVEAGVVVLGRHDLFHREVGPAGSPRSASTGPRRRIESRAIDSFLDLAEGDYVVHVSHGIARFHGMYMLEQRGAENGKLGTRIEESSARSALHSSRSALEEHLLLEFRDGVYVYVPVSQIDLVQKYVGGGRTEPELSKFGGTAWLKRKQKVEAAVLDLAVEMIQIQALRESQPGFAYPQDTPWQAEFEASFPYEETADQLTSIAEIKSDMERPRPMDRLLCGDVGYGKTELALRAAFKAVDNGKQVAVLVPTTVLAEQHFRTFRERFATYPFTVDCLNRFRSAADQRETLRRVTKGGVDVVIGTHRLLSGDVKFKDLGLVIVDEEQRFGVEHKERLKQLRAMVDILTLSATPIPRTLSMALLGIRDISNLETPPSNRLAIETRIARFDAPLIRHAILRELNREGQVYFVHNRVHDIQAIAEELKRIVPEARIVIGHGQMSGEQLEAAMLAFVRKEADILLATTIIESGLDIPNANTMFIDQADIYGLADLHQLRGRVGRNKQRAYAYLLLDRDRAVSPQAAKRLKAIEEFTELGAGFKIAMRDLEIRGAGNILGTQQSGHIAAVGYELYCTLLENAARKLKHQPPKTPLEVNVDLPWPAFLPRDYVPGQRLRIEVYRRLARLRDVRKLNDFRQELRDRYGLPPEPAEWLLRTAEVRMLAAKWQIASLHRDGPDLVFSYRHRKNADKLAARSQQRLKVIDEKTLYCRLQPGEDEPAAMYALVRHLLRPAKETV